MFARQVLLSLKPRSAEAFSKAIEHEIIPLLRKQEGFQDEIILIASDGAEAVGISLWEERANADAYDRKVYPQIMKTLGKFLDGAPTIEVYEVSNSTFHKVTFPASV
jgi:hypothetical protein